MEESHLGAWLVLIVAAINLLFQVSMLAFNIIGVPTGLIH